MRRLVRFPDWFGAVALAAPRSAMVAWCSSSIGLLGLSLVLSLHFVVAAPARGAINVSIDLDPDTPGIQTELEVASGDDLTAEIVVVTDGDGLSSYAFSIEFDSSELDLAAPPAATEFLPSGFDANLTALGVEAETEDAGNGVGQVLTFEAVSFSTGPVNSTFVAGQIDFTATSPDDGAGLDLESGLFHLGVDGAFDNAGQPATVNFSGAFVDPQSCGDGVVEGAEQCDDGNIIGLDGCSQLCRNENQYVFSGTAEGGSVDFTVDGYQVTLLTSAGQTATDVANAMAAAINGDPDLFALGAAATGVGALLVVAGSIDSVTIGDPGLVAAVPLSPIGIPFLLVALVASALLGFRRSAAVRQP